MAQASQTQQSQKTRPQEMRLGGDAKGDLVYHLSEYARENPTTAALWCLGIGFVLGWKLKPW